MWQAFIIVDFETSTHSTRCLFQLRASEALGGDSIGGSIVDIDCSFDIKGILLSLKDNLSHFKEDAETNDKAEVQFESGFPGPQFDRLQHRLTSHETTADTRYTSDNTPGASPTGDQTVEVSETRHSGESLGGMVRSEAWSINDSVPFDCNAIISADDLCWIGLQGTADVWEILLVDLLINAHART